MSYEEQFGRQLDAAAARIAAGGLPRRRPAAPAGLAAAALVAAAIVVAVLVHGHGAPERDAAPARHHSGFAILDRPLNDADRTLQHRLRNDTFFKPPRGLPPGSEHPRLGDARLAATRDGIDMVVAHSNLGGVCFYVLGPRQGGGSCDKPWPDGTTKRASPVLAQDFLTWLLPDGVKTITGVRRDGTTADFDVHDNVAIVPTGNAEFRTLRWDIHGRPAGANVSIGIPLDTQPGVTGQAALQRRAQLWTLTIAGGYDGDRVSLWVKAAGRPQQPLVRPDGRQALDQIGGPAQRFTVMVTPPAHPGRFTTVIVRRGARPDGDVLFTGRLR